LALDHLGHLWETYWFGSPHTVLLNPIVNSLYFVRLELSGPHHSFPLSWRFSFLFFYNHFETFCVFAFESFLPSFIEMWHPNKCNNSGRGHSRHKVHQCCCSVLQIVALQCLAKAIVTDTHGESQTEDSIYTRENLYEILGTPVKTSLLEKLLEILAIIIILSPISSVCGYPRIIPACNHDNPTVDFVSFCNPKKSQVYAIQRKQFKPYQIKTSTIFMQFLGLFITQTLGIQSKI